MFRIIKRALLLVLIIVSQNILAQNYYNAPYTRYKIGDLMNSGFAANKGMGGTSIALRAKNRINHLNPASYTSQDTSSFLFQIGFNSRFVKIETDNFSDNSNNMNIDYLAIGFPIKKWVKMSAGLVPYSRIQYSFSETRTSPDIGEKTRFEYTGFGGFNEFYVGLGVTFKDLISIGGNLNYLFGSLDRTESSYLPDLETYSAEVKKEANFIASDFYGKVGIQIHPVIKEKHKLIFGAAADINTAIKVKLKGSTIRYNTKYDGTRIYQDSLYFSIDTLAPISLPNKFAFGLSYSFDDIFLVTGEYIRQDWSGTYIVESNFTPGVYESFRFGAEYNPVPLKVKTRESYFKRMHYRVGGYYTKSYLNFKGKNISDMGVSVGIGLPIKNARNMFSGSMCNIGYQFGVRGTTEMGLIKDTYHTITLGLILHDFWFLKPKYD